MAGKYGGEQGAAGVAEKAAVQKHGGTHGGGEFFEGVDGAEAFGMDHGDAGAGEGGHDAEDDEGIIVFGDEGEEATERGEGNAQREKEDAALAGAEMADYELEAVGSEVEDGDQGDAHGEGEGELFSDEGQERRIDAAEAVGKEVNEGQGRELGLSLIHI